MHDKQVVITYKCDVNGDWTAPREQLTNTAVKVFTNKMDGMGIAGLNRDLIEERLQSPGGFKPDFKVLNELHNRQHGFD